MSRSEAPIANIAARPGAPGADLPQAVAAGAAHARPRRRGVAGGGRDGRPWAERWTRSADAHAALLRRVMDQTTRRVLRGETVPAGDKILSLFEPHADIVRKGRATPEDIFRSIFKAADKKVAASKGGQQAAIESLLVYAACVPASIIM